MGNRVTRVQIACHITASRIAHHSSLTLLQKGQIHRKDAKNAKKSKIFSSAFSAKSLCPRRLNGFLQRSHLLVNRRCGFQLRWVRSPTVIMAVMAVVGLKIAPTLWAAPVPRRMNQAEMGKM